MSILIKPEDDEDFLFSFAKSFSSVIEHGRVNIPEEFGYCYVMVFLFGKHMRMVVRNYALFEEVVITRNSDWLAGKYGIYIT